MAASSNSNKDASSLEEVPSQQQQHIKHINQKTDINSESDTVEPSIIGGVIC